jgi:hypothetical protein
MAKLTTVLLLTGYRKHIKHLFFTAALPDDRPVGAEKCSSLLIETLL